MTETIPKPREGGAGADDASESDPLLLLAPLRIEARAIRRGLRDLSRPPGRDPHRPCPCRAAHGVGDHAGGAARPGA